MAFRNYSTLFFAVAAVTLTLHLVYAVVFRDVIAVSELHLEISHLGENVKLQDVGRSEVAAARTFYWVLVAVEIAAIPIFVVAARRVVQVDESGGVPTVVDAYSHLRSGADSMSLRFGGGGWATVIAGAAVALLAGFLFEQASLLLTEMVPDDWLFLATGLVRGLAPAVGAPFFLASVVAAGRPETAPAPA